MGHGRRPFASRTGSIWAVRTSASISALTRIRRAPILAKRQHPPPTPPASEGTDTIHSPPWRPAPLLGLHRIPQRACARRTAAAHLVRPGGARRSAPVRRDGRPALRPFPGGPGRNPRGPAHRGRSLGPADPARLARRRRRLVAVGVADDRAINVDHAVRDRADARRGSERAQAALAAPVLGDRRRHPAQTGGLVGLAAARRPDAASGPSAGRRADRRSGGPRGLDARGSRQDASDETSPRHAAVSDRAVARRRPARQRHLTLGLQAVGKPVGGADPAVGGHAHPIGPTETR